MVLSFAVIADDIYGRFFPISFRVGLGGGTTARSKCNAFCLKKRATIGRIQEDQKHNDIKRRERKKTRVIVGPGTDEMEGQKPPLTKSISRASFCPWSFSLSADLHRCPCRFRPLGAVASLFRLGFERSPFAEPLLSLASCAISEEHTRPIELKKRRKGPTVEVDAVHATR